jgi:hypothetical protein
LTDVALGQLVDEVVEDGPEVDKEVTDEEWQVLRRFGIHPKLAEVVRAVRFVIADDSARITGKIPRDVIVDECEMFSCPLQLEDVARRLHAA